jgi:hypothetical protein
MRRVLPGEPDPAVDLNAVGRHPGKRLGTVAVRDGGGDRERVPGRLARRRRDRVVGRRPRGLDVHGHLRTPVLDRLERADGPPELNARLGVRDRELHHSLRAADLLGGQGGRRQVPHPVQRGLRAPRHAQALRFGAAEFDGGHLAGEVHRRQQRDRDARRPRVGEVQAGPSLVERRHDEQVGDVPVEHVPDSSVEAGGPVSAGRHGARPLVAAQQPGVRDRREERAVADVGQVLPGNGIVERGQRGGGDDGRGQERAAVQRPAHLLHDHRELDDAAARAPELLGHRESLQAHLGHQAPQFRVVPAVRLHRRSHRLFRAVPGEQVPCRGPQRGVLRGQDKIHRRSALLSVSTMISKR